MEHINNLKERISRCKEMEAYLWRVNTESGRRQLQLNHGALKGMIVEINKEIQHLDADNKLFVDFHSATVKEIKELMQSLEILLAKQAEDLNNIDKLSTRQISQILDGDKGLAHISETSQKILALEQKLEQKLSENQKTLIDVAVKDPVMLILTSKILDEPLTREILILALREHLHKGTYGVADQLYDKYFRGKQDQEVLKILFEDKKFLNMLGLKFFQDEGFVFLQNEQQLFQSALDKLDFSVLKDLSSKKTMIASEIDQVYARIYLQASNSMQPAVALDFAAPKAIEQWVRTLPLPSQEIMDKIYQQILFVDTKSSITHRLDFIDFTRIKPSLKCIQSVLIQFVTNATRRFSQKEKYQELSKIILKIAYPADVDKIRKILATIEEETGILGVTKKN